MVNPQQFVIGLAAFLTWGCTGSIDERAPSGDPPSSAAGGHGATSGSGGGAAPGPATRPSDDTCRGGVDPGRWLLRRLTNREYVDTVRDLLGTPADVFGKVRLHEDGSPGLYDTNVEQQKLTPQHLERYLAMATEIAGELIVSPRRNTTIGCDPTLADRASCTRSFIDGFGKRAYRRPLTAGERDALTTLALDEPDASQGIANVVRAVLGSPSFLFRPEVGLDDPSRPGLRRLTGVELATRLSFLLRGRGPSPELLDAAEKGDLDDVAGIHRLANQLLESPEGRGTMRRFGEQWLGLQALAVTERNKTKFPAWNDELRAAMLEETARVLEDATFGASPDFLNVINARHTFVNHPLARLYGLPAPAGTAWQKSEMAAAPRAGLVTHASVLTATGRGDAGLSAIWRGKFVREALLCEELPPAPANVPAIPAPSPTTSDRERLEQHRAAPECAACHEKMDPVGFGLDRYDAIGGYRERDDSGATISARGEFVGEPNGLFDGGVALADKLRSMPRVEACVVSQVRDWALARNHDDSDACLTSAMARAFETSGHDLRAALLAFVTSDAFRYRR